MLKDNCEKNKKYDERGRVEIIGELNKVGQVAPGFFVQLYMFQKDRIDGLQNSKSLFKSEWYCADGLHINGEKDLCCINHWTTRVFDNCPSG